MVALACRAQGRCSMPSFVFALIVSCTQFALSQDQEQAWALNFALPGDQAEGKTKVIRADVVHGNLHLHGLEADTKLIGEFSLPVRATLAEICQSPYPVSGNLVQDILTFESTPYTLMMSWWILPDGRMTTPAECAAKFGPMLNDPVEFMQLLTWKLQNHKPTEEVDTHAWEAVISEPGISAYDVLFSKSARVPPPAVASKPTTTVPPGSVPDAEGGVGLQEVEAECVPYCPPKEQGWTATYHRRREFSSLLPKCKSAGSACLCAAVGKCKWVPDGRGGMTCNTSAVSDGVGCNHCAVQSRCPPDPAKLCDMEIDPCSCVGSKGDCRWDPEESKCVQRFGGETPCTSCTRQEHCDAPKVLYISPPYSSMMSGKQRAIRLTFDRNMVISPINGGVQLLCHGIDWPLPLPKDAIRAEDDVVILNVHAIANQRVRRCDLTIAEGALRDEDGLQYLGMVHGDTSGYGFWLGDTTGPRIVLHDPENTARGVPLETTATIVFDEEVFLRPSFSVNLFALGEGQGADQNTDQVVATLQTSDVSAEPKSISIRLSGHLQRDVSYSLQIPAGAMVDSFDNAFKGLDYGDYFFRTSDVVVQAAQEDGMAQEIILFLVGVILGLCCLCCFCVGLIICAFLTKIRLNDLQDDVESITKEDAIDFFEFGEKNAEPMEMIYGLGDAFDDPPPPNIEKKTGWITTYDKPRTPPPGQHRLQK